MNEVIKMHEKIPDLTLSPLSANLNSDLEKIKVENDET